MARHLLSVLAWLAIVAGAPSLLLAEGRPPARTFIVPIMNGAQEVPPRTTRAHGISVFNLHPNGNEQRAVLSRRGRQDHQRRGRAHPLSAAGSQRTDRVWLL
jgi:hypothetical protein